MKRIIWGFIKIFIIVGLLIWASHEFFPKTINDEPVSNVVVEELEELTEPIEEISPPVEEVEIITRNSVPETAQQKKYAQYSENAGTPEMFSGEITLHGTTPLSTQLAQTFGEPTYNWANLNIHKKTFWILSELTLQEINVDSARSLHGAIISVENGTVAIDLSRLSMPTVSTSTISRVPQFIVPSLNTEDATHSLPAKKTFRRMSARSWQQVLELETPGRGTQKREILHKLIPNF